VTFLEMADMALEEPENVAAAIVAAVNAGGGVAAVVAPLATMSRAGRARVLRLLQEAMPERTGRATVAPAGGVADAR